VQGARRQRAGELTGVRVLGLPVCGRPGSSSIAGRSSWYFTLRSYPSRLAAVSLALVLSHAHAAQPAAGDLADLSLEQLANIEVTSVSRRAERLSDAAASIYVITSEDIRRSGVTSLPEALRLAPNLQVARTSASGYAISARGFNNTIGNKLLVLIDGRTVYTPLFSGVFWDAQDVMLEDIDRIEVISGPGGTLWGANAVNGVINVITRRARDTQGGLIAGGVGNLESGGGVRYGGKFGADGHYRVYGRYFDRDNTKRADGTAVADAWDKGQVGFRADWSSGASRGFTVQGDFYDGKEEQAPTGNATISGANLITRWNERLAGGSDLRVQFYYDRTKRDQATFGETLDILDLEMQHALPAAGAHRILWGGGYRFAKDSVRNSAGFAFLPADKDLAWANVFVQDEIRLREGLELTIGIKLESNDYTGWENLPSVRLAWKPAPNQLIWGALSRAVRAPARLDRELFAPAAPPFLLAGGPNFESEIANVAEIGIRGQVSSTLSYSATVFYHDFDDLRSIEPLPGGGFVIANGVEGTTKGIEAWGNWQAAKSWRLSAGGMYLDKDLKSKPGSLDPTGPSAQGNDPEYQWQVRSSLNLTARHEFDVIVRNVGSLPNPVVPAYVAVDAWLGWRVSRGVELSLTLQNLFDSTHAEFGDPATRSVFERGAFLKLVWRL
jgi:iron complex outermembrane recepter protein